MFKCGFVRSNFSFAMMRHLRVLRMCCRCPVGSGGGTRTRDPTIMSRVLLPTELLRHVRRARRPAPASPLTESNRRPLPYHGSALPSELRGQGPRRIAQHLTFPAVRRTRLVERRDADALRAIYNAEVLETTVTFDLVARTLAEQVAWIDDHAGSHP